MLFKYLKQLKCNTANFFRRYTNILAIHETFLPRNIPCLQYTYTIIINYSNLFLYEYNRIGLCIVLFAIIIIIRLLKM